VRTPTVKPEGTGSKGFASGDLPGGSLACGNVTTYAQELEASIAMLDSVASARVVVDGRRIDGVDIVAAAGVDAGTIERDVRIRAVERFGAVIDAGSITVATVVRTGR
jgi:hypothetical protein